MEQTTDQDPAGLVCFVVLQGPVVVKPEFNGWNSDSLAWDAESDRHLTDTSTCVQRRTFEASFLFTHSLSRVSHLFSLKRIMRRREQAAWSRGPVG